MQTSLDLVSRLTQQEQKTLSLPATITAGILSLIIILNCLLSDNTLAECMLDFFIGTSTLTYILVLHFVLLPLTYQYRMIHWGIVFVNGIGTAVLPYIAPVWSLPVSMILIVAVVIVTAILAGRGPTYLYVLLYTTINLFLIGQNLESSVMGWVQILFLPVMSFLVAETVLKLTSIIAKHMRRLETINSIARQIATTIEPTEVIALINRAIQDTRLADSYFVGLLKDNRLWLELFYDDGEYFPSLELDLENSLSGWVLKNRRSLLLRNLPKEIEALGLPIQPVGKEKSSLSWMGTVMDAGGNLLGIVAMASYRRNAFDSSDLKLLESIAQQAALVIDNSYHHAEVEEQSRLDSLTKVYNHGYFLVFLQEFIEFARKSRRPISLIMLDIDNFKHYNDTYGHQVGDQVLTELVATIRENLRSTDIIGRWGGEEFGILLADSDGIHACQVARRIQQSIAKIRILDKKGNATPVLTISQGIAVCPDETEIVNVLVHLADQRLYQAKARGRNQIEPDSANCNEENIELGD
jgi:diguanylate cyclase (GGDEF)-like protein